MRDIDEVNAAKKSKIKKKVAMILPNGIAPNAIGKV